jgi:hypothetical protein
VNKLVSMPDNGQAAQRADKLHKLAAKILTVRLFSLTGIVNNKIIIPIPHIPPMI